MAEEKKIIIDDDWKEEAQKEKEALAAALEKEKQQPQSPHALGKPNFAMLATSFASQALMGLGEVENPFTQKREVNLGEAKFHIDLLEMLEQKTKGNLSSEEVRLLDSLLFDLRMRFLDVMKKTSAAKPPS